MRHRAPPPPLELRALVFDLAEQAYSDGIDEATAHSTAQLRAVVDHVGAITAPCTCGESCTLSPNAP